MKIIILVFIALSCLSCGGNDSVTLKTEVKLSELKENYRVKKMEECDKQFELNLNALADSILIVLSKKNKYDSLSIPTDSIRPEKPEIEFPEFTKPGKPE